jgi:hypothetical protein
MEFLKVIFFILTIIVIFLRVFIRKNLDKSVRNYLTSSLIITILLLIVVVLKLHHFLRFEFNIPNTATYIIISIIFVYHFLKFKSILLKSRVSLLVLSIGLITLAILLDILTDGKTIKFPSSDLVEEIFRIFGAGFWLLYYVSYIYKLDKR